MFPENVTCHAIGEAAIDVSGLQAGIYFVRIDRYFLRKIVVWINIYTILAPIFQRVLMGSDSFEKSKCKKQIIRSPLNYDFNMIKIKKHD